MSFIRSVKKSLQKEIRYRQILGRNQTSQNTQTQTASKQRDGKIFHLFGSVHIKALRKLIWPRKRQNQRTLVEFYNLLK